MLNRLWIQRVAALIFLAFVVAALSQQAPMIGNVVHVEISGFRNDKGQAVCALFSSAADFPKKPDKAIAQTKSGISGHRAVCEFPGVSPGTYAVSVFHDENSNGKMDSNFMGIPKEGVGASNDARGHFGPPKFDAAAVHYSGGRLDLKITVYYLLFTICEVRGLDL